MAAPLQSPYDSADEQTADITELRIAGRDDQPEPAADAMSIEHFATFAQRAFDFVAHSLEEANARIDRLTAERDEALARARSLEDEMVRHERVAPGARADRPWQSALSRVPPEPVGRSKWTVALLMLALLPLAAILIVRPGIIPAPHGFPIDPVRAEIVELVLIAFLFVLCVWLARSRR